MKRLLIAVAAGVGAGFGLGGCAMSRVDQLHAHAARVERKLSDEQSRTLREGSVAEARQARLDRLSELRATLSAANVGLGAVRFLPEDQQDLGYDVIDEVYGTIEWNIPLGPNDKLKPLPLQFSGGKLQLNK